MFPFCLNIFNLSKLYGIYFKYKKIFTYKYGIPNNTY